MYVVLAPGNTKINSEVKYLICSSTKSISSIVLSSLSKIRLQTIDMMCFSVFITSSIHPEAVLFQIAHGFGGVELIFFKIHLQMY